MAEEVDIRLDDKGDGVVAIQKLLVRNGADLKFDGDFGPVTEQAVKDFQRNNKLTEDGIVGVRTLNALAN